MDIKFSGIEELSEQLKKLNFSDRKPAIARGIVKALEPTKEMAESISPIDTGQLSRDWRIQEERVSDVNEVSAEIGVLSRSFYAGFLEYGTAHFSPKPILGPALEATIDEIEGRLVEAINREIDLAIA